MDRLEILGKKIYMARRKLGYKKRIDFAKILGLDEKEIKKYEEGVEPPPLHLIHFLCSSLKIDPRAFIYGEIGVVKFRGKQNLSITDEAKIAAIKDGIETLIELGKAHYNRFDFIGDPNPEISAKEFIEHYSLDKKDFNTWDKVVKVLSERDIFVFAIPLENSSALIHDSEPFFIVLNSNEPMDRWSFSLLHEIGHLIAPSEIKGTDDEEKYGDIFAGSVLIPKEIRYSLWKGLKNFVKNRNYKTFFDKVRKLNNKVSPEAVFYTLIKEFDFDFGKLAQFKKKAKEIREKEATFAEKYLFPKKYKQLVEDLYKDGFITIGRKQELLLEDFQK